MTKPAPPASQEEYDDARYLLALSYAPRIYRCKKCQWPCVVGYCCNKCGDTNPSQPEQPHDR